MEPDAASRNQAGFLQWRRQNLRVKEVTFTVFLLLVVPPVFQTKSRHELCGLWQNHCSVDVAQALEDARLDPIPLPALDLLQLDASANGTMYNLICGKECKEPCLRLPWPWGLGTSFVPTFLKFLRGGIQMVCESHLATGLVETATVYTISLTGLGSCRDYDCTVSQWLLLYD